VGQQVGNPDNRGGDGGWWYGVELLPQKVEKAVVGFAGFAVLGTAVIVIVLCVDWLFSRKKG
jgi:hypothetical protein